MNRLLRFYNKNKRLVWTTIGTVVLIICIIQLLNNYYKKNNEENKEERIQKYTSSNYAIISDEVINEDIANSNSNIISQFIDYCNNKEYGKAYSLLTKDCKEKFFNTEDEFKQYIDSIFTKKMMYNYKSWISESGRYTYRIEIYEDILSTGKVANEKIETYYTVVKEDGKNKLNIKDYVGTETINKSATAYNITITAVKKDIYIEYEVYTFDVLNKSGRKVKLDSGDYLDAMYLKNSNSVTRVCKRDAIEEDKLIIGFTGKDIEIRYNNAYGSSSRIEKIIFQDVVLDYNEYITEQNKEQYIKRGLIEVNI